MALHQVIVEPQADGLRVDEIIRRYLPGLTAVTVREAFSHRDVKLEGKRVRQDARVRAGQLVQVYCMEAPEQSLDVVFEDEDVLIINKRAGISVEPDEGSGLCLTELALRHVREKSPEAFAPVACHRLDHQTCGITVFAKNDKAAQVLQQAFRDRTMDKRYICLVHGIPKPPQATCRAWLVKDAEAARVTVLDREVKGARPIITAYETLESGEISRLRVHLITGRTHQIRAHMAALGHPLLGDEVYGSHKLNRLHHARRLMLCAAELTLDTGGALPHLDGLTFRVSCPF